MLSEKQKLLLKRNAIKLEEKMKILNQSNDGVKISSVAKSVNLNEVNHSDNLETVGT